MEKRILKIIFIIVIFLSIVIFPDATKAEKETLQDLIDDLNQLEENLEENSKNKDLTEEKIKQIQNNIVKLGFDIKEVEDNIIQLQDDIENLVIEIESKDSEIKELISFSQLTNSNNLYLEYIFGASSLTDFIYRLSIIEQLTKYNESLIKDMSDNIEQKNNKTKTLENEKTKLEQREEELSIEQQKLGERMNFLDEDARTLEEEMIDVRKTIDNYKKLGCRPNDILEVCSRIPTDSDFLRPLSQGKITSPYGIRIDPLDPDNYAWHHAIDIGGNSTGTPIYATASGRVILVTHVEKPWIPNSSCGGNYIVIQHKVNGVYYASKYAHLNKVLVSENQEVDKNTIIGLVGGGESYDRCTTGPHLHFSIAKGIYSQDFYYFREPYTINPISVINFPALGVWYNNRYEKH